MVKAFCSGLVAVQLEIAVEVGRAHAKALGDDLYFIGMGNEISHSLIASGRAGLQARVHATLSALEALALSACQAESRLLKR